MKKTIMFLSICATVALLALPAFANRVRLQPGNDSQDECSEENKTAWYTEFTQKLKTDQPRAYEVAKKYLACPAPDPVPADKAAIIDYLKKFVTAYEKLHSKDALTVPLAKKDYPAAFEGAKKVFAEDPNYLKGYQDLAIAGAVSGNAALADDSIAYARKAIEMIEAGKTPEGANPFDKDDALARLNYSLGFLLKQKGQNAESIPYFIKAASYNSKIKSLPQTYSNLADAYQLGPFAKQQAEYKEKYEGKPETEESKLALANINQTVDRMIDAYARCVALGSNDPLKAEWMASLTAWYKFRHNDSEAGLNEMLASILSKPVPPVPTPITSLPTPTPTPGAGTSTSGTSNGSPGAPPKTGAANKTAASTKTNGPTKPRRSHAPN